MNTYLRAAIDAAKAAGSLIRENFMQPLQVNAAEAHDLKLELDVRAQEVITELLLREFPNTSVLGEEGSAETAHAEGDWIVDPIDGTVNFFYGIPHFCVSIAFRRAQQIEVGVIYDPIKNELWHAIRGEPPLSRGARIDRDGRGRFAGGGARFRDRHRNARHVYSGDDRQRRRRQRAAVARGQAAFDQGRRGAIEFFQRVLFQPFFPASHGHDAHGIPQALERMKSL